jgi:hypothetical protein
MKYPNRIESYVEYGWNLLKECKFEALATLYTLVKARIQSGILSGDDLISIESVMEASLIAKAVLNLDKDALRSCKYCPPTLLKILNLFI